MNKPVAWMHKNPKYPISKHWSQEYNIPLYTHPAELTDEEIGNFEYQIIRACGLSTANSDINPIGLKRIIKDILRKAQDK